MAEVTLGNVGNIWKESSRDEQAEIVYLLQGQGISQARIASQVGASLRRIRTRKTDANALIMRGSIPSGKFQATIEPEEIIECEMDRRDRLVIGREARNGITHLVVAQNVLKEMRELVSAARPIDVRLPLVTVHDGVKGTEEVLMHISDLHFCRDVPAAIDEKTVEEALWRYGVQSMKIIERHRRHTNVRVLKIACNGDNLHGLHNYLAQARDVTGSLSYQVAKTAWLLIRFVEPLVPFFDHIEIVVMGGNHGKITPKDDLMTENAEFMMGEIIKAYFTKEERVTVNVAYGSFYHIMKVGGQRFLVTHGDQIQNGSAESIVAAVKRWDQTATIPTFDHAIMGHFHSKHLLSIPPRHGEQYRSRNIYVGGTASLEDSYLEGKGSCPNHQFWLLFVNEKRVTAAYDIDLYSND